ncbi:MAG: M20/M25/M40 family metallo-hydrolase, partial [Zavarzinia sp.]|nr:M20/M25/M40 family metallo-hydrolase [Zavarzinia sp.]
DHVITSPTDDWIQHVFALAAETLGEPPEPRGASYFTDASILTSAFGDVPTVIIGPGEPTMAHKSDEYCAVARIGEAVALYGALAKDWQRRMGRNV